MKTLKEIYKFIILFIIGAVLYMGIEIGFRGYTFYLMGLCGAFAFVTIGYTNEFIEWECPIWIQGIFSGLVITGYELIFGLLFNQDYNMWSYLDLPYNYQGQICLLFSIIWCFLGTFAIWFDDWLRWKFFNEEKPHYILF